MYLISPLLLPEIFGTAHGFADLPIVDIRRVRIDELDSSPVFFCHRIQALGRADQLWQSAACEGMLSKNPTQNLNGKVSLSSRHLLPGHSHCKEWEGTTGEGLCSGSAMNLAAPGRAAGYCKKLCVRLPHVNGFASAATKHTNRWNSLEKRQVDAARAWRKKRARQSSIIISRKYTTATSLPVARRTKKQTKKQKKD